MSTITKNHHDLDLIRQALEGDNGEDQQRIAEVGLRWLALMLKKNRMYGCGIWDIPIFNPDVPVGQSILVRMSDKVSRLKTLLSGKATDEIGESIDDTIGDLGAYCLLYLSRPTDNPCHQNPDT